MFATIFYGLFVLISLYVVLQSMFGYFEYKSSYLLDRIVLVGLWFGVFADLSIMFIKSLGY